MEAIRITSSQNPRIKAAARLRDHGARREQGRILIDGEREILTAHRAGIQFIEVFFDRDRCDEALIDTLMKDCVGKHTTFIEVPASVLEKITFGSRNEGLVVVAAAPQRSLDDMQLQSSTPLVVILEDVEKPGNVGAILRTASAAGVDGLIAVGSSADFDNPNAIRASLGTIFSVPCCTASIDQVQRWVRDKGLAICAAKVDATTTYFDFDFTRPTAIVLGSEAKGLSAGWSGNDVRSVRIPLRGAADSLNVSVAAAVLVYEALRQRRGL